MGHGIPRQMDILCRTNGLAPQRCKSCLVSQRRRALDCVGWPRWVNLRPQTERIRWAESRCPTSVLCRDESQ